jgi:hypothetical protein
MTTKKKTTPKDKNPLKKKKQSAQPAKKRRRDKNRRVIGKHKQTGQQKTKIRITKPKIKPEAVEELEKITAELKEKQKEFCKQYLLTGTNGTKAYELVYKCTYDSARSLASNLLANINIKDYIAYLQRNSASVVGITKEKIAQAFADMADNTMASYHNKWISKKEFDELTDKQKACIETIETKETTFRGQTTVEIKFKIYSRTEALRELKKMYGYDAADKSEVKHSGMIQNIISKPMTKEELKSFNETLEENV